jgi:hypothetical protein
MNRSINWLAALALLSFHLTAVRADPVVWTDWTSGTAGANGTAEGVLNIAGTPVDVSYSGEMAFIQYDGTGANYWVPDAYTSPTVDNPPTSTDIIALSSASAKTITFSQAITNPLFAVVSLNGNGYQFDRDFEILGFGPGYWGNGTLTKSNPSPGVYQLNGSGEPHGVIEFQGTFTSVSWTSLTNEFWNGFTIGVRGLAVPEPASLALFGLTAGLAVLCRRGC